MAVARPLVRRVSGTRLRAVSIAFVVAAAIGLVAIPVYAAPRDGAVRAALRVRRRRARPAVARVVVRPRLRRPRAHASRSSCSRRSSRCGSTGPSGSAARSRSCSPSAGRCSPRARCCSSRGSRPRRADVAARVVAPLRLVAPDGRLDLGGRPGRIARALGEPAGGAPHRRARRLRAALLERRVRVGQRADRLGRRGGDRPSADDRVAVGDVVRQGDPLEGRAAARRDADRRGEPAAGRGRDSGSAGDDPDIGPATATLLRRLVGSEILLVAGDHLRGRRALEPAAAGEGARQPRRHSDPRRPGPVSKTFERNGYDVKVDVTPNRAAQPNTFTLSLTQGRQAGHGRQRDDDLRDARHGDGPAGVRVQGVAARRVTGTRRRRS